MTKTAIITGAAKNIGKGIAKGLLTEGYSCILIDKDKQALESTASEFRSLGVCQEYVMDISDLEAVDDFIAWLNSKHIDVSILVNNAGYESKDDVLGLSKGSLSTSLNTNQAGPFYLSSRVSNLMTASKANGSIIFITSTHSSVTRMHPLYSSSKAATEMFMKEAALELAPSGIRVNAVAPGIVIDTADLQKNKYVPMGFSQQPTDIAECVNFLVSDKARFITGQTIIVDGGFSIAHTHYWKSQDKL